MKFKALLTSLLLLPTLACAQPAEDFLAFRLQPDSEPLPEASNVDPLEKLNRFIFRLNDTLDVYMLVPVTKAYRAVVPLPGRQGIYNFSINLTQANTTLYQLLQGKPLKAGVSIARFFINLTLGFGGLFDPASDMGLPLYSEDLGQVLGTWGVGPGPYVVIPFLGPSTMRDALARLPQAVIDVQYSQFNTDDGITFFVLDTLAFRESLLGAEELFTGDKYIAFRDAYLSRRQWQVSDGKIDIDAEDEDLLEEFFDEEWDEEADESEPSARLPETRAAPPAFPFPIALYSERRKQLALMQMTRDFPAALPPHADTEDNSTPDEVGLQLHHWKISG